MNAFEQAQAAAERYERSTGARETVQRRRDETGHYIVDDPAQISARAERLVRRGDVPVAAVEKLAGESPVRLFERIIGVSRDFQAANFLSRGARAITSVGRVADRSSRPMGTGFLVSPRLLLTNNHVLPDEDTARAVVVEFGAEIGIDNDPSPWSRFTLDPDGCFVTDERLDYTLVMVRPAPDGRAAGALFGWNQLIVRQGKIVTGEPVNVAGHPSGRLKEIAVRNSELVLQLDDFLHYSADTEPGSSGSPVFNDQWEVVALHHVGTDEFNEGVRISVILRDLAGRDLAPEVRADLDMGTPAVQEKVLPRAAGLTARPAAFGGAGKLLFLHGRGQAGHDPVTMRRQWTAGLNKGLTLAELAPIDPGDAWMPFYGDRLAAAIGSAEALAGDHAGAFAPRSPTARLLYEQLISEAAMMAGMPSDGRREGLVSGVQGALSWLASATNLDHLLIAAVFRDVAAYLDDPAVRRAVLDAVLRTMPESGPVVLVAHSLGTVVAMDLLTELPSRVEVPLLVTVGSPLGLDSVHRRLLSGGPVRPSRVGRWLNVWCPADPVCIGCPLEDDWKGQVEERAVENPLQRAHDVEEYLSHPTIARTIASNLSP